MGRTLQSPPFVPGRGPAISNPAPRTARLPRCPESRSGGHTLFRIEAMQLTVVVGAFTAPPHSGTELRTGTAPIAAWSSRFSVLGPPSLKSIAVPHS
jgi:hypothetical protein